MKFEKYVSGGLENNSYYFPDANLLIDAPRKISEKISDASIEKVFLTHGHYDHTDGLLEILGINPDLEVYVSEDELDFIENHTPDLFERISWKLFSEIFEENKTSSAEGPEELACLMQDFPEFKMFKTPGHTPGSVCFLFNNNLFTGDTLFRGAVGRTDLFGGDEEILQDSLKKIFTLPDEIVVYPGHGEESQIAIERE